MGRAAHVCDHGASAAWCAGGELELASPSSTRSVPPPWSASSTIAANTTYGASYFAPNGHYAGDNDFFSSSGYDAAPLHALRSGVDGANGVYRYGASSAFPTDTYQASNYWVGVVFASLAAVVGRG